MSKHAEMFLGVESANPYNAPLRVLEFPASLSVMFGLTKAAIRALFVACAALIAVAQPSGQRLPPVRVESHLVNLTILATDKKGNPVTDLDPEEIEVREDGAAQKLFSFDAAVGRGPQTASEMRLPSTGPERSEASEVRTTRPRYIVFVVDNSATEFADRQRALADTRKWLESHHTCADLVALVSLGMGVKVWQKFTADSDLLLRAIARMEREQVPPAESPRVDRLLQQLAQCASIPERGIAMRCAEGPPQQFTTEETAMLNERKGVLKAMIRSLAGFPGEKRVVYFGDGFRTNPGILATKAYAIFFGDNSILQSRLNAPDDLRQVTSAALRANVTLFTIDAHGLRATPPGGDASQFSALLARGTFAVSNFENEWVHGTEDSLSVLAADTGGRMFYGNNDLAGFADQAVGSLEGTYYATYVPTNRHFDGHYRKISIRSLRAGVVVHTRAGYFAVEVREIPLEAKVSEPRPQQGRYLVASRVRLATEALTWHGRGEKRNDQVAVTRTVTNSKGELVSTQVDFTGLKPESPQVDVGWLLTPGRYTCTITVTEVDSSNFGTTTFQVVVPVTETHLR